MRLRKDLLATKLGQTALEVYAQVCPFCGYGGSHKVKDEWQGSGQHGFATTRRCHCCTGVFMNVYKFEADDYVVVACREAKP